MFGLDVVLCVEDFAQQIVKRNRVLVGRRNGQHREELRYLGEPRGISPRVFRRVQVF